MIRRLRSREPAAWTILAATLILSCVRVTLRPAGPDETPIAIDVPAVGATEANTTQSFAPAIRDAKGLLRSVYEMRAIGFPSGDRVRLIELKRDLVGDVGWEPGHGLPVPGGAPWPIARWSEHVTLGYPCWAPPYPCKRIPR